MKIKLLICATALFTFLSSSALAEEFHDITLASLSGYYIIDGNGYLISGDGTTYDLSDVSPNSPTKMAAFSAYSDGFAIMLLTDDDPVCLVPLEEKGTTDTGGIYYAVYNNYVGKTDEAEFQEESEVLFEDYIFGNDYLVALREPLSTFFGIDGTIDYASQTMKTMEGNGYETPEEAVAAYLDAFQQGDLNKMISTFSMETFVENYNIEKRVDQMRMYRYDFFIPPVSTYAQGLNLETRRSNITDYIRRQYLTLTDAKIYDEPFFNLKDDVSSSDFIEETFAMDDSTVFEGFRFDKEFYEPAELYGDYNSERSLRRREEMQEIYGCQDLQPVVAVFYINDIPYVLCMDAARYGDSWYNVDLDSVISYDLGLAIVNGGISKVSDLW